VGVGEGLGASESLPASQEVGFSEGRAAQLQAPKITTAAGVQHLQLGKGQGEAPDG